MDKRRDLAANINQRSLQCGLKHLPRIALLHFDVFIFFHGAFTPNTQYKFTSDDYTLQGNLCQTMPWEQHNFWLWVVPFWDFTKIVAQLRR
jgi:hypothetical protein